MDHPVRALLCDIEGTLVFKGQPIPGAAAALAALRSRNVPLRFLTNITRRLPDAIAADLQRAGIDAAPGEIETATTAAAAFLRARPGKSAALFVPEAVLPAFAGIPRDEEAPDYVVIGDLGEGFTFDVLNHAYLLLDNGAALIALHKGLYWFDGPRKQIDSGFFVAGLEAASGRAATLIGKPSPHFFAAALERLGAKPEETAVVGDDLVADIGGAAGSGLRSILVETGKFDPAKHEAKPEPTWRVKSFAEVPGLVG
ncbi:MAG TPA: HAD-IIA family hydrolase [Candidatus Methylacidiphilales bacterium]